MESRNILWVDPQVNNHENTNYSNSSEFKEFRIVKYTDYTQADVFLKNSKDYWIVMTSGTYGKMLVPTIHEYKNVISIIVFTMNKELHKQWASTYAKVGDKVFYHFNEVVSSLKQKF